MLLVQACVKVWFMSAMSASFREENGYKIPYCQIVDRHTISSYHLTIVLPPPSCVLGVCRYVRTLHAFVKVRNKVPTK